MPAAARTKRTGDLIGGCSRSSRGRGCRVAGARGLQIGLDLARQPCRRHHPRERAPAENPAAQRPIVAHVHRHRHAAISRVLDAAATGARRAPGRREPRAHRTRSLPAPPGRCLHRASWRTRRRRRARVERERLLFERHRRDPVNGERPDGLVFGDVRQQIQPALGKGQALRVDQVVLDPAARHRVVAHGRDAKVQRRLEQPRHDVGWLAPPRPAGRPWRRARVGSRSRNCRMRGDSIFSSRANALVRSRRKGCRPPPPGCCGSGTARTARPA